MPKSRWTDGAAYSATSASWLFGEQPRRRQAPTSDQVAHAKAPHHSHHTNTPTTLSTLDTALQRSARSSLDHTRTSILTDASPVSFAPTMSAPPGGHSLVPPNQCLPGACTDCRHRINVNDPQLISLVNKLQDVFATVGVCVASRLR